MEHNGRVQTDKSEEEKKEWKEACDNRARRDKWTQIKRPYIHTTEDPYERKGRQSENAKSCQQGEKRKEQNAER